MTVSPRVVAVALAASGLALGLYAENGRRALGRSLDLALLDLAAGFVFLLAGAVVVARRPRNRCWWLLMLAGTTWFLSTLAGVGSEDVALVGFALAGWHYLFLGWLMLAFPTGRLGDAFARTVLGVLTVVLVARSLVRLLVYVPPDGTGCDCVHNRFTPVSDRRWFDAVESAYPWVVSAVFAAAVLAVVLRWRRSSGPGRRMLGPVLVMAVAVVAQIAYAQVIRQQLAWAVVRSEDLFVLVVLVRSAAAYSYVVGLRRTESSRSAVVDLVGELDDAADLGAMTAALRRALQDPTLRLVPWSPGAVLKPRAGQAVTMVDGADRRLAALVHDEALLEDPGLVGAISAAVRLTVDNERLRRELQDRLDDLAASRARIIAAADDERRRIERDLHDGTQQRLVTIALRLRLARGRLDEGGLALAADTLEQAIADLTEAIEDVRDLARGIHPAILHESGLAVALESLLDRSPLQVSSSIEVGRQPPEAVAAAAYFCVSEALTNVAKHARSSQVDLRVLDEGTALRIVVSDDGVGGAGDDAAGSGLAGLADRVSAAGGRLDIDSPPGGGTRLEVVLPCGS